MEVLLVTTEVSRVRMLVRTKVSRVRMLGRSPHFSNRGCKSHGESVEMT